MENSNKVEQVLVHVIFYDKLKAVMNQLKIKKVDELEAHNLVYPEYLEMLIEKALKSPSTPITVYFNIFFGSENKVSEELYNKYLEKIEAIFNKWLDTELKDFDSKKIRDLIPNVSFKRVSGLKGLDEDMGFRLSKVERILNESERDKFTRMVGSLKAFYFSQSIDLAKNLVIALHQSNKEKFFLCDWDFLNNIEHQTKLMKINHPISSINIKLNGNELPIHQNLLIRRDSQEIAHNVLKENGYFITSDNKVTLDQMKVLVLIMNKCYESIVDVSKKATYDNLLSSFQKNARNENEKKYIKNIFDEKFLQNETKMLVELIYYSKLLGIEKCEAKWGGSWHDKRDTVAKLSTKNIDWRQKFYHQKFYHANEKAYGDFYPNKELFLSEELIEFLKHNKGNKTKEVDFS